MRALKAGVELPFIPGHEVAGEIVALGAGVRGFRVGERVATTQRSHVCGDCRTAREPLCAEAVFLGDKGVKGGYAEYLRADVGVIARVYDGVSYEHAAIAACAIGTGLHAIGEVVRLRLGETAMITGAGGGLGVHAVQLAVLAGAFVIAQTTSPGKVDAILRAGAHEVLAQRGEDFSAQVRTRSSGGVDVVIDNVGSSQVQPTRKSLAPCGRWVMVGQLSGEFTPFNPAQLFLRSISLLSATSTTRRELEETMGSRPRARVEAAQSARDPLASRADRWPQHVQSGRRRPGPPHLRLHRFVG